MPLVVDWSEIAKILPGLDLMTAIERGFGAYSRGETVVPPVGELIFPGGEAHIKYGYIRGDATFVVKVATGFYANAKTGLSSSNGVMMLFNASTGEPVAVLLDEGRLTDIRTAVAGAIAAKYLAPANVEAIGIIGTGIQARLQAKYLRSVTPCRRLYVYGRSRHAIESYARELHEDGFEVTLCASPADVATSANLLVTTTPAKEPLLRASDIRPGIHITAVGADTPEKSEIEPKAFAKADRIVADSILQCLERGELHHAVDAGIVDRTHIIELGAIITGNAKGRQDAHEITIADLTGVAVQDIKIAQAVFAAVQSEERAT